MLPSDTKVAKPPTSAVSIAVPALPPPDGITLDDAETTVCDCQFLTRNILPGQVAADGKVNVHVEPVLLLINQNVESATVLSAVIVTGTEPA